MIGIGRVLFSFSVDRFDTRGVIAAVAPFLRIRGRRKDYPIDTLIPSSPNLLLPCSSKFMKSVSLGRGGSLPPL